MNNSERIMTTNGSVQIYNSFFENNVDALFSLDVDGNFLKVNAAAVKVLKSSQASVIGESFYDLIVPQDKKRALEVYEKAVQGISNSVTLNIRDFNNKIILLEISNTPIVVESETTITCVARIINQRVDLKEEKDLLYNVNYHIENGETLKAGVELALKELCNSFESVVGEFWMPVTNKRFLKIFSTYYSGKEETEAFVRAADEIILKSGQGVQGTSWKTGKIVWEEDILNEPFFLRKKSASKAGICSCVSIPLIVKNELLGIISLYFDKTQKEDPGLTETLSTISYHLASDITKRKGTEELDLFFELSKDLLCIAGFDGSLKKINGSFESVLGYDPTNLSFNSLFEIVHPDDLEHTQSEIASLEEGEPEQYFENRIKCAGGIYRWFEWLAHALPGEDYFFCIGRDISFQKSKEEELLRIKYAVDGTNDAISIADKDGNPLYHNQSFINLIGYNTEELKYIGGLRRLYVDLRVADKIHKRLKKGQSFEGDVQLLSKEKHIIDFNLRANAIINRNKETIGLLNILTDITGRKKLEEKLQHEKSFAESIINALPGTFYLIDNKGKFRRWNKNFETMAEYTTEEVAKMNPKDFFDEKEKPLIERKIFEVFKSGKSYVEVPFLTKSGKKVPYFFTGVLTKLHDETFLVGFGIDITERKNAEEKLKEAHEALARRADELIASNEELENFAYIASHDLQEPLRMISGFLNLIQEKHEGQFDEDSLQYINFAINGAERMKTLISDLLAYSRVGTNMENLSVLNMNEVVQNVLNIYDKEIKENNAKIIVSELPEIYGNTSQITQLFQNLVGNALKYRTEKDPVVEINVNEEGGFYRFSIADNGIGIKEKYFEKIFEIFQRLHSRSEYSGTGIGLAICKKIVERHGGKIWVDSNDGTGSVFYVTLRK